MTPALAEPPRRAKPAAAPPAARGPQSPTVRVRPRAAAGVVLHTDRGTVELPVAAPDFDTFRAWTLSDDFPRSGKYSYLAGRLEIDLTSESLNTHASLKVDLAAALHVLIVATRLGRVYSDSARVSDPAVGLSCEPDAVVLLHETLRTGRVEFTPKANRPDDHIEIVGPPDLVAEIVSDSSTAKDRRHEPPLLFASGVTEFWRVDARGDAVRFDLHRRGADGWDAFEPDADGFRRSDLLGRSFRITAEPPVERTVTYLIEDRA